VNREKSFSVSNNDKIKLSFTTPEDFNFLTDITLKLGTYSETWRVTTEIENLNVIFTPEDFTNESNLQLNTDYNSNQMTISELNLNSNLPVVLSNSNVSYEVERNGSIVKRFVDSPIGIVNNDKIRLRLKSSNLYNTSVSTTMKIGNTSTDWILTTRSAPPINITFTVTRSSPFDNQIVFELQSGTGTSILTFGSDNRVFTETLYQGSTYILQSTTGSLRITSGILELEDGIDNDWDDLRVSASSGSFSSVDGIFYYSI
jgi:hypothetical protein